VKKCDVVSWTTRSQGRTLLKKGAIAFVVEPGQSFAEAVVVWGQPRSSHYLKVWNMQGRRRDESYGILIQEVGRDKMTLYWPLVASLELVRCAA